MKPALGCKLFGAHQALSGIGNTVVLLHSVTGCNFGTLSFRLPGRMAGVSQACTVISDDDVVFGGEPSLECALTSVLELYRPEAVFVLGGCVSAMTGEDLRGAIRRADTGGTPVFYLEAPGFQQDFTLGYEQALAQLVDAMEPCRKSKIPSVNILGLGADDYRLGQDIAALRALLGEEVRLGTVFARCDWKDVREAAGACLNLVFGRGAALAEKMRERFGIPYVQLDYPYGTQGMEALRACLFERLGIILPPIPPEGITQRLTPIYAYLQALYGMPAAVIGSAARARGMRRFLEQELGMEVVTFAEREALGNLEDFYDRVRGEEAAILFGSSYEQELSDELEIPLVRFDYPVIDEVCVSHRPYIGADGTVCLVEDIINHVMRARKLRGALYQ